MITTTPLFGFIIPTYNRPELVIKAVEAVKRQTYARWILVVVDDASRIDYSSAVATFNDPRITYIKRTVNGGCNAARTTGIDEVVRQGADFMISSGDDEEFDPRCLEVVCEKIAAHPECGWFMSNTSGDAKSSTRQIVKEGHYDWFDHYLYGKELRGDKTHVIRLSTLGKIRYDGRYRASNMWPFFAPLAARTQIWAYPYASKVIRYLPDGITKNASRYPKTWLEVYSRVGKHAAAVRYRPTKLAAYKYLLLESAKTPARALRVLFSRRKPKATAR